MAKIPTANNRREKKYDVHMSAPQYDVKGLAEVSAYIKDAPTGKYTVQNTTHVSAGRGFMVANQVIVVTERQASFKVLVLNTEPASGRGALYFSIDEVFAEAILT
jgi:hypothetical protein